MLKDFKAFILKGNLIEIAVGLILALAFAAVVTAFVEDLITPVIAAIGGQPDFSQLEFTINESTFRYGDFINKVITFVVVGFVLFLIVKATARMIKAKEATTKPCAFCKSTVPLDATRCPACTSDLTS